MTMEFKYLYEMQATGSVGVEDIGNFCMSCTNDLFQEYILVVKTELGVTQVFTFGPWLVDSQYPVYNCSLSLTKFDYSSSKIEKIVDKLLNSGIPISQATVITLEEAKDRIVDLRRFLDGDSA